MYKYDYQIYMLSIVNGHSNYHFKKNMITKYAFPLLMDTVIFFNGTHEL